MRNDLRSLTDLNTLKGHMKAELHNIGTVAGVQLSMRAYMKLVMNYEFLRVSDAYLGIFWIC